MRLEIEIPEAFEKHFNHDRFKESLEIIMADIEYQSDIGVSLMSGNYEFETVAMLEKALNNSKVIKDVELEEQIREKAIDDFVKLFKSKTSMENILVDEIAEQLKVGGENE